MRRPVVRVKVVDAATGAVLRSETKAAFNSGVRASEALVREIARERHMTYEGEKPSSTGDAFHKTSYARRWIGRDGHTVIATVEKEPEGA